MPDLYGERLDYAGDHLLESNTPADPFVLFDAWLADAFVAKERGVLPEPTAMVHSVEGNKRITVWLGMMFRVPSGHSAVHGCGAASPIGELYNGQLSLVAFGDLPGGQGHPYRARRIAGFAVTVEGA